MIIDFLSTVSIFSEIDKDSLNEVSEITTERTYPKGSMIILEEELI